MNEQTIATPIVLRSWEDCIAKENPGFQCISFGTMLYQCHAMNISISFLSLLVLGFFGVTSTSAVSPQRKKSEKKNRINIIHNYITIVMSSIIFHIKILVCTIWISDLSLPPPLLTLSQKLQMPFPGDWVTRRKGGAAILPPKNCLITALMRRMIVLSYLIF